MAAYELFAATTVNLFIEHIKTKAEAYGWTIDFFGLYNGNNRLHLHNVHGSHFEIWVSSSSDFYIVACTGYASASAPTAQPGVSASQFLTANAATFMAVCPSSIFLKIFRDGVRAQPFQFGTIVDKIGAWTGGTCISSTVWTYNSDSWPFWGASLSSQLQSQALVNGAWSSPNVSAGGAVKGTCSSALYTKMPFAYSGGILPAPMLLVQLDPTTPSNLHPIGYAPDVRFFAGGTAYLQLEEITIDGEVWVAISTTETTTAFSQAPDILIRLAV